MSIKEMIGGWRQSQKISLSEIRQYSDQNIEPFALQNIALGWYEELNALGHSENIFTLRFGELELNCIQILSNELKRYGADALRDVHTARAFAAESQKRPWLSFSTKFRQASSLSQAIYDQKPSIEGRLSSALHHALHTSRLIAYHSKQNVSRTIDKQKQFRRPKLAKQSDVILAIPREPTHVLDHTSLENELYQHSGVSIEYLAATTRLKQLLQTKYRVIHPLETQPIFPIKKYLKIREYALSKCLDISSVDSDQSLALSRTLLDILKINLTELCRFATSLINIISKRSPRMLLIGNPLTMEGQIAVRIGQQLDIPSVALEHGTIRADDPTLKRCLVDKFFVWGEPSKRNLMSGGFSEDRIELVGAPRTDSLLKSFQSTSSNAEKYILVATSGPGNQVSEEEHRRFIRVLRQSVIDTPEIKWVTKLHRKDKPAYYTEAGELPENLTVIEADYAKQGADIFHYLRNASALLTVVSTSALDAMLVNVPVITADIREKSSQQKRPIEFIQNKCTYAIEGSADLTHAVERLSQDTLDATIEENAARYINRQYYNRGAASPAAAGKIIELLAARSL